MREGAGAGEAVGARALVELAAEVGGGARDLTDHLRRAGEDAGPRAVEEVLLQSHLFLGFPRALAALRTWRGLDGGGGGAGGRDAGKGEASGGTAERRARGEEVCRRVYGPAYGSLRENVRRLHPDLDEWMVGHGYGEVLGREGLDLATRELCIVATLAADASPSGPLRSHLRGALRVGASPEAVEAALEAGVRRLGSADRRRKARRLWRDVRERAGETD